MKENKTKPTSQNVTDFLNATADKRMRDDCYTILGMMQKASKCEPVMWGSSIVGFGSYRYTYASGRVGDCVLIGFSPRKRAISIYLMGGLSPVEAELSKLGKHKTGKGCLYITSLSDVKPQVLRNIFSKSIANTRRAIARTSA